MDNFTFCPPDERHLEEIAAYRQEFLAVGSSLDGTGSLRQMEDPRDWLQQAEDLRQEECVPTGWVPSSQFIYEKDGRILGMLQIRHRFNDYLAQYGGHIGYSVRPSERRKGYASQMLRLSLPYCRALGLEKVLITCDDDNEASRRTILKNGGLYESTVFEPDEGVHLQRYWIGL